MEKEEYNKLFDWGEGLWYVLLSLRQGEVYGPAVILPRYLWVVLPLWWL